MAASFHQLLFNPEVHQRFGAGENRNEPARIGIQSEAHDGDIGRRRFGGGVEGLRAFLGSKIAVNLMPRKGLRQASKKFIGQMNFTVEAIATI